MTAPTSTPRPVRDCTHKTVHHEHGTLNAYKQDRCRCAPCTAASTMNERRRRLAEHLGAARGLLDAAPVRAHVKALQEQGLGYRRVAELAGVSAPTVLRITTRDPYRADGLPQQRVSVVVAERLLAVRASLDLVTDGAVIDATGTLRRLHALHARGWSRRLLAARLGIDHNALTHIEQAGTASARMARAVRALYEELWDLAPPAATPHERAAITRTLRWARENSWPVPAMWDDETIDDPSAAPADPGAEDDDMTARLDELLFLASTGEDLDRAARRLGWGSWESARYRAVSRGHRAGRLRSPEASEVAA